MAFSGNEFLKVAAGIALLAGGGAVADYYMVTLPHQGEVVEQAQADARKAAQTAEADRQRAQDAEQDRKRNAYRICVSSADTDYSNNWGIACAARAKAIEDSYKACTAYAGSTPNQCRELYPIVSPTSCTLSSPIAGTLNDQLREAKDACMKEAQSGIAD